MKTEIIQRHNRQEDSQKTMLNVLVLGTVKLAFAFSTINAFQRSGNIVDCVKQVVWPPGSADTILPARVQEPNSIGRGRDIW